MHRACSDIGFFYVGVKGYLTQEEMDNVLNMGRAFFALPQEEKDSIALDKSDGARSGSSFFSFSLAVKADEGTGYQTLYRNITQGVVDHHEGLDFYAPSPYPPSSTPLDGNRSQLGHLEGENLWPSRPTDFRSTVEVWIEKMKVLGMAIMKCMAAGFGMNEEEWAQLRSRLSDSFWVMRVIGGFSGIVAPPMNTRAFSTISWVGRKIESSPQGTHHSQRAQKGLAVVATKTMAA